MRCGSGARDPGRCRCTRRLYNADDKHHERCATLWDDARSHFLVSPLIAAEVCYFLARDLGPDVEASFLESFSAGQLILAKLTERDITRMVELVRKYADLTKSGIGGADASVVALAERLRITEVATIDRRHFQVIRPAHCSAFTLL